ncbi:hypothetical protein AAG614_03870 [Citromicrobium bathyomarinum]
MAIGDVSYWIEKSNKSGLVSEESYIVGRGNELFLRILGGQQERHVMTATASEDDGGIKVFGDRARLVEAAFKIGHKWETVPIAKRDRLDREYVSICTLTQSEGESDEEYDEDLDKFLTEFFSILDVGRGPEDRARDEMIDIYQAIAGDDTGGAVYLSDGLWLGSDGSIEDRGR